MKQPLLLISIALLSIFTLLAQENMFIFQSGSTTTGLETSSIDSMQFSENDTLFTIYDSGDTLISLPVLTIDSITFTSGLPVIRTAKTILTLEQEKVKMAIVLVSAGSSSVTAKGLCWSAYGLPTIDSSKVAPTTATASADSSVVWLTSLDGGSAYYVRAYATNSSGTTYGQLITVRTPDYTLPVIETTSVTYSGNIQALCVGKVTSSGGYPLLKSRGFCYSTSPNPTINDNVVAYGWANGTYQTTITFPAANVTYYVRAYATNNLGTSYGNAIAVTPFTGNVTYNLAFTPASTTEQTYYNLIKTAMDSACYYYNRYTTFSANIYVYYNSGIPTAQASFYGAIGFGPNTWYMHVATAMHEMAHYFGSGTTTVWQNLTVDGVYTGAAATAMLRTVTGNPSAVLYADDTHFWDYGLNYRDEATSVNVYIGHAKIVNAMRTDCGW